MGLTMKQHCRHSRSPVLEVMEERCLLSSIIEYNVPTPNAGLQRITLGPDGNYWFTEQNANKIGRINPITHAITEIPLPSGTGPSYVAGDPLGGNSVWFAAPAWNMLVRMNTTTFATSTFTLSTDGLIGGITVGKDPTTPAQEAVWFIASGAINDDGSSSDIVGWLNPLTGSTGRQVIVPATSDPDTGSNGIFTGQDGNIWFGETNSCQITRVNTSSAITQFSLPAGSAPFNLAMGPDGKIWFGDLQLPQAKIASFDPTTGAVSEFAMPITGATAWSITSVNGEDNAMYFNYGSGIGRIDLATHAITEISAPAGDSEITSGPDGGIWFTDSKNGAIGHVTTTVATQTTLSVAPTTPIASQTITFTATVTRTSGWPITPEGDMLFWVDNVLKENMPLGANAQAVLTTALSAGTHTVVATYNSATGFDSSTVTQTVVVTTPTQTSLSVTPTVPITEQPTTFTATVIPASGTATPNGNVRFVVDNLSSTYASLTIVNGHAQAVLTTALSAGTHTVVATYNSATGFDSSSAIQTVVVYAPPTVIAVQRYGTGLQPTQIVLTFNVPLNPSTTLNPNNYTLLDPNGRKIAIKWAAYTVASKTVTFVPRQRLSLNVHYRLTVTGIYSTVGIPLYSGSFQTVLTRSNHVLPPKKTKK